MLAFLDVFVLIVDVSACLLFVVAVRSSAVIALVGRLRYSLVCCFGIGSSIVVVLVVVVFSICEKQGRLKTMASEETLC